MMGQNILRGAKERLGGQKYAKYNKINNNSESFRGARLLPGRRHPPLLVSGLTKIQPVNYVLVP